MATEAEKLNNLGLNAFSPEKGIDDRLVLDAGRPTCLLKSTSTVAQPDPARLSTACLFTRYEVAAAVDGPDGNLEVLFLAPGQLIPAFRKDGNNWVQVLRCLEIRAYVMPLFKKAVWVQGKNGPLYNDFEALAKQPASREMRMSAPGGESRLRPHPKLPGALPMRKYDGPSVARQLDTTQMQAGDFIKLFGDFPLVEMDTPDVFPFRFVTGNLDADYDATAAAGMGSIFTSANTYDEVAANPLTKGMVGDLKPTHLPISFTYAEQHFDNFDVARYDAGVRDRLKDESWVFIQHRLSPYIGTVIEPALGYAASDRILQPFGREELPPGAFLTPWANYKSKTPDYNSLAPYGYDQARRFESGVYSETNG